MAKVTKKDLQALLSAWFTKTTPEWRYNAEAANYMVPWDSRNWNIKDVCSNAKVINDDSEGGAQHFYVAAAQIFLDGATPFGTPIPKCLNSSGWRGKPGDENTGLGWFWGFEGNWGGGMDSQYLPHHKIHVALWNSLKKDWQAWFDAAPASSPDYGPTSWEIKNPVHLMILKWASKMYAKGSKTGIENLLSDSTNYQPGASTDRGELVHPTRADFVVPCTAYKWGSSNAFGLGEKGTYYINSFGGTATKNGDKWTISSPSGAPTTHYVTSETHSHPLKDWLEDEKWKAYLKAVRTHYKLADERFPVHSLQQFQERIWERLALLAPGEGECKIEVDYLNHGTQNIGLVSRWVNPSKQWLDSSMLADMPPIPAITYLKGSEHVIMDFWAAKNQSKITSVGGKVNESLFEEGTPLRGPFFKRADSGSDPAEKTEYGTNVNYITHGQQNADGSINPNDVSPGFNAISTIPFPVNLVGVWWDSDPDTGSVTKRNLDLGWDFCDIYQYAYARQGSSAYYDAGLDKVVIPASIVSIRDAGWREWNKQNNDKQSWIHYIFASKIKEMKLEGKRLRLFKADDALGGHMGTEASTLYGTVDADSPILNKDGQELSASNYIKLPEGNLKQIAQALYTDPDGKYYLAFREHVGHWINTRMEEHRNDSGHIPKNWYEGLTGVDKQLLWKCPVIGFQQVRAAFQNDQNGREMMGKLYTRYVKLSTTTQKIQKGISAFETLVAQQAGAKADAEDASKYGITEGSPLILKLHELFEKYWKEDLGPPNSLFGYRGNGFSTSTQDSSKTYAGTNEYHQGQYPDGTVVLEGLTPLQEEAIKQPEGYEDDVKCWLDIFEKVGNSIMIGDIVVPGEEETGGGASKLWGLFQLAVGYIGESKRAFSSVHIGAAAGEQLESPAVHGGPEPVEDEHGTVSDENWTPFVKNNINRTATPYGCNGLFEGRTHSVGGYSWRPVDDWQNPLFSGMVMPIKRLRTWADEGGYTGSPTKNVGHTGTWNKDEYDVLSHYNWGKKVYKRVRDDPVEVKCIEWQPYGWYGQQRGFRHRALDQYGLSPALLNWRYYDGNKKPKYSEEYYPNDNFIFSQQTWAIAAAIIPAVSYPKTNAYIAGLIAEIIFQGGGKEKMAEAAAWHLAQANAASQINETKATGVAQLSEKQIKARQDFFQQCALLLNMEAFVDSQRALMKMCLNSPGAGAYTSDQVNSVDPYGRFPTKPQSKTVWKSNNIGPWAGRFHMLYDEGHQNSMMNKFYVPRHMPVLENMPPSVVSMLVPKIRLYKVIDFDKGGPQQIEFQFPQTGLGLGGTNNDPYERIKSIYKSTFDRGNGAGIKSFNFTFQGTSPATARNDIVADLVLTFQSFSDFFKERENGDDKKFKFVDLVLYPPKSKKYGYHSGIRDQYDPSYYRIRADVGYQDLDSYTQKEIDKIMGKGAGKKLQQTISQMNQSYYLCMVDHDIDLQEDGSVEVKIQYRAYIETLMKSNRMDALEDSTVRDLRKQRQKRLEEAWAAGLCTRDEDMEIIRTEMQKQDQVISTLSQQSIMRRLYEINAVYWCELSRDAKQSWERTGFFSNKPTFRSSQQIALDYTVKKKKESSSAGTTVATSDYAKIWKEHTDDPSGLVNFKFMEEDVGANQRIHYFYMGDLIYVILNCLYGDERGASDIKDPTALNTKLLLGSFEYYSWEGERKRANVANIPISCHYFFEWYTQNVVKPKRTGYPIMYFVRDLCNQLISTMLGQTCRRVSINSRIQFQTGNLIAPGAAITVGNKIHTVDPFTNMLHSRANGKSGLRWTRSNLAINLQKEYKDGNLPLFVEQNQGPHGVQIGSLYNYIIIYGLQTPVMNHPGRGNRDKDAETGIRHFNIGSRAGIIKNIKFNKTDVQFLREARHLNQGVNGLLQLGAVYKASISMVGNTLWYPGMEVYIDPIGVGGTDFGSPTNALRDKEGYPLSIANALGFGGYHLITKVKSEISSGKFDTTVTAQFFFSGAPQDQGQDVKVAELESKKSLSGIEEIDPSVGVSSGCTELVNMIQSDTESMQENYAIGLDRLEDE